ncbi:MAG: hypothetical protein H6Q74_2446 [Firmicutes bacterium]|nr:hypothetical protein [Bacillota bacterium]
MSVENWHIDDKMGAILVLRRVAFGLLILVITLISVGCLDNKDNSLPESADYLNHPLELVEAEVKLNDSGNPEARVVVKNISPKTVDAYMVGIFCYDRFGDKVKPYAQGSNRFSGINQRTVRPGQTFGDDYYWTLRGHENTTKIEVVLEKVHFTDGTMWIPKAGQRIAIKGALDQ